MIVFTSPRIVVESRRQGGFRWHSPNYYGREENRQGEGNIAQFWSWVQRAICTTPEHIDHVCAILRDFEQHDCFPVFPRLAPGSDSSVRLKVNKLYRERPTVILVDTEALRLSQVKRTGNVVIQHWSRRVGLSAPILVKHPRQVPLSVDTGLMARAALRRLWPSEKRWA